MSQQIRMPKGVKAIQLIQAFSTFSYAIIYSSLTLFMVKQLGVTQSSANNIFGAFLAFNYVLHLLGGMLGGKYVSNRNLFFVTTIFQCVGIALLALASECFLYIGLSIFLVGCGINTTCLNSMLTESFDAKDNRRERAFFINYSAMNAGFFGGYLLSGFFDATNQYQLLFWVGAISNLITLVVMWYFWQHLNIASKGYQKSRASIIYMGLCFLSLFLITCLKYSELSNHLVMLISGITLSSILFISFRQRSAIDSQKIRAFLILTVTSIVFWMIYFTGPMGVTLFIKNNVDRSVGSLTIATQWVSNINAIIIIIGSPLFAMLIDKLKEQGFKITVTQQFVWAFIFLAASFFSLSCGILTSDALGFTHLSWLILHITLQGMGELLIGPVGYAMIGRIAPRHLQGTLMGTWMMVSGVSASLSHYFSNLMVKTNAINPLVTNSDYYHVFNQLGVWAVVGAIVLVAVSGMLNKHTENTEKLVMS